RDRAVLGGRAAHGARGAGPAVRATGRARGDVPRVRHGQHGDPLHRAGGAVPRRRPGGRVHGRRDDAVPLRAHARRRRRVGLAHGDDPRPALDRPARRAGPRARARRRRRPGGVPARGGPGRGRPGGRRQPAGAGARAVRRLRARHGGRRRAARHRGGRRARAHPPPQAHAEAEPAHGRRGARQGAHRGRQPHAAAVAGCLRDVQRHGHPRARTRRRAGAAVGVARAAHPRPGTTRPARRRRARGRRRAHGRRGAAARRGGPLMEITNYVVLAAVLFAIGATTVLLRRNAMVVFMGVELMLNATNLAFVTFARLHGDLTGQVLAFFVMVVAAAEVVVGLAIIVTIFRTRRSASVDDVNLLKG